MQERRPKIGVGIIVIKHVDDTSYVMLHQRKGDFAEGYWGSGGGHVEHGESLMTAALRELIEEAGEDLVVNNVNFLCVSNFTSLAPKHYVDVAFCAEYVSGEPRNSAPDETSDWQWFNIDNLPKPLFPPIVNYLSALKGDGEFYDNHSKTYSPGKSV
jgi:8-oxo-dGTP diphosphatase